VNERLEPHAYIEELRRVRVSITEITSRVEALDEVLQKIGWVRGGRFGFARVRWFIEHRRGHLRCSRAGSGVDLSRKVHRVLRLFLL
jgi:hypothetical protein